ncbi:MAG: arginine decarboxylase, partial [Sulfurimonas sp.]
MPSLIQIINEIREKNVKGPTILRFPHLIKKQILTLYNYFEKAINDNNYHGKFQAVFPLKVNQFPAVVEAITVKGKEYNYGLEAGSKAELILAMAKTPKEANITVNGFKDEEIKARVNEVAALLEIDNKLDALPNTLSGGQQQRVA